MLNIFEELLGHTLQHSTGYCTQRAYSPYVSCQSAARITHELASKAVAGSRVILVAFAARI